MLRKIYDWSPIKLSNNKYLGLELSFSNRNVWLNGINVADFGVSLGKMP